MGQLQRIADLKEDRRPIAVFSMFLDDTITISQTIQWVRLTGPGDPVDYVIPPEMWDSVNGYIVIPYDGFYLALATVYVENIDGAGNRDYELAVGLELNWAGSDPPIQCAIGQEDNKALTVSCIAGFPAVAGDRIDALGRIYSSQFTQVASVRFSVQVIKF